MFTEHYRAGRDTYRSWDADGIDMTPGDAANGYARVHGEEAGDEFHQGWIDAMEGVL